jgi:hypothetical protein
VDASDTQTESMAGSNDRNSGRAVDVLDAAMSIEDLPPPNTKRWVIRRKAEVVAGVRSGLITIEEACERYTLSIEEFLSWQRLIETYGIRGLRATRIQDYRDDVRDSD